MQAVSPIVRRLLQLLLTAIGARRVLEVGTLGGASAVAIAQALPGDGRVVTLEREPRHADFARRWIARAGVAHKVELRVGRALDLLPALDGERFDVVFLDADKEPLPTYFEWALRLLRPGGLVIAGEITISVADIDLIFVGLNVLISSVETANEVLRKRQTE